MGNDLAHLTFRISHSTLHIPHNSRNKLRHLPGSVSVQSSGLAPSPLCRHPPDGTQSPTQETQSPPPIVESHRHRRRGPSLVFLP